MPPRKRRRRTDPQSSKEVERIADRASERHKDYDLWRNRVARAKEIRKNWEDDFEVDKGERFFLGQQTDLTGGRSLLVINRFTPTVKTLRPNLLFQAPKFFVRPKSGRTEPVAERTAAIGEGVLEAIARQDDNLETAGGLAVTQGFFRIGTLKVCYDPRMEPNPQKGKPIIQTVNGEPVLNELQEPVMVRDPLTGEVIREPDEVMTDEVYRWDWVDSANMLLPDEGPDQTKWTWIGEEIVVPLEDAKEDQRFSAELRGRLVANETARKLRPSSQTTRKGIERATGEEFLRYVELYDVRHKRFRVIADGQPFEDFLADDPIPDWIDNHPYALLILGEPILGPDPSPWPIPVVKDWLHPQSEWNIRRRQAMEGAKRSARKILYTEGAFPDEDEATKALQSPNDLEAAKAVDINQVRVLEVPPLNLDVWKDLMALNQDWISVTGQPGARMSDPEKSTATEASLVERAASLRDSDMQKAVTRWLTQAGQKMLQCVKATLTLDLWVQLREMDDKEFKLYLERVFQVPMEMQDMMGKAFPGLKEAYKERLGSQKWLAVTREELQFEADVTVAPGSTRPRNLETERADWFRFLEILGRAPQLALSPTLLRETAAKFGGTIDEKIVDELVALANKMVEVNANQAGRNQGGANGVSGPGGPQTGAILNALMGGAS